jgi:hypothetical protein
MIIPMKQIILLIVVLTTLLPSAFSQTKAVQTELRPPLYFDISPPIRDMMQITPTKPVESVIEVANKIGHREFNNRISNGFPFAEDQLWQKQDGTWLPDNSAPMQNFEGINNLSNVYPPDTQGDVSLDKYVQVVNFNFAVYSKTGAVLLGPASLSTIWAGIPSPWNGTNSGDPIVLYDQAADRWMISQFSIPNYTQMAMLVAISQTSDPTGSWYRYVYNFGNKLPDYPKFGIWNDGYYLSVNLFSNGPTWVWDGVSACALDRTKMLAGDPSAGIIQFTLPATADPGPLLPSDWDGANPPQTGEPCYFTYFDDWTHPTNDYLKIWSFHADWVIPANSTFTWTDTLLVSPFDAEICTAVRGRCIPQPGTTIKLESLSDRLMYRMQYRNFGTHRSMVTNSSVDVDGSGHSGIRWYELRKSNAGWGIYQQGTYAPDANHRWLGSIAMNLMGDIALGYSVSNGTSLYPSIRYTGRHANDPLGTMTIAEQTIMTGSGSQTGTSARWGDYSMMSVDPVNDRTFWFTTEYLATTGSLPWRTRIASFQFDNSPTVATLTPSGVTGTTATLHGTINPQGLPTTWRFEYGTTTAYGNTTSVVNAGSLPTTQNVNAGISGLTLGTTYHYRIVGVNYEGTTYGADYSLIGANTTITTTPVTAITNNTATTGGNIVIDATVPVYTRGVCYGTSPNPDLSGSFTSNGNGVGAFSTNLTGLQGNTTYYARAYASGLNGIYYGDQVSFTTECNSALLPVSENFTSPTWPSCWTQKLTASGNNLWSVQSFNYTGAGANEMTATWYPVSGAYNETRLILPPVNTLGNTVLYLSFIHYYDTYLNGGVTLKIQTSPDGINWTNDTWSVLTSSSNIGPESVTSTITTNVNLPRTYIAFVITGDLYNYDVWALDNIQLIGLPVLSGSPVTGLTTSSAISGGNILSDGGSPILSRGVCWSTTPNPVISGNHTNDGTGTGLFTSSITGLLPNTAYYLRSYATSAVGTTYGNEITFRTLCIPSVLPFNETFNGTTIPDCWSQVDNKGNGQIWKFGVITGVTILPVLTGNYAYLNSDSYGSGQSQNADLVSPRIDMSNYGLVTLKFDHYYRSFTNQTGSLYYSIDNGTTWTLIQQFTTTSANPAVFSQVIPALTGQSQVRFKWNLTATWGWYWAIDNIQVTGMPLATPVTNVTVGNGTINCFEALNTISVAGSGTTFIVQNGGSATMVAGQKVNFYPGTRVFSGGYLHGYIAPSGPFCSSPLSMPANILLSETREATVPGASQPVFKVYPNPTNGRFRVELVSGEIPALLKVEVLTSQGSSLGVNKAESAKIMEVSLEDKPAGLYLVRVSCGDRQEVFKLIRY